MEEIKELIGKIQVISDKPLDSFIEFLEEGSGKFKEYISLLREISTKIQHLHAEEVRQLENTHTELLAEEKKFNAGRTVHTTELAKLKGAVIEQETTKARNTQQIGALESQIDGLTQLYDKKKAEYDLLVDKIEEIKNPRPLALLMGNAHEDRYLPKI